MALTESPVAADAALSASMSSGSSMVMKYRFGIVETVFYIWYI